MQTEMVTDIDLANPQGDLAKANDLCVAILRRRDEIALEIDANPVTEDNYADESTAATQKQLKAAVEDLREKGKAYVKKLVEESGALPVVVAIDSRLVDYSTRADPMSAYGSLSLRLKEREELIKQFKADKNPEPVEGWYIGVSCTKSQMKKILASIEKAGGVVEYTEKKAEKKGRK